MKVVKTQEGLLPLLIMRATDLRKKKGFGVLEKNYVCGPKMFRCKARKKLNREAYIKIR